VSNAAAFSTALESTRQGANEIRLANWRISRLLIRQSGWSKALAAALIDLDLTTCVPSRLN
jgi:hypothetical protein